MWRKTMYGNYSAHFDSQSSSGDIVQFNQFNLIYGNALATAPEGPVLDLGCGQGEWLEWMRQKGYPHLCGVDLSAEDLQVAANRGFEVHHSHVSDFLNGHENRFAMIHAKDLIEHLDKNELVELGQAALKALLPGGLFVASTFNAQAPLSSTTRYGDFTHEFGFTRSSISQWLLACGFGSVFSKGYHACPLSLKGRVRKMAYRLIAAVCELIVTLRHGNSGNTSCLPDLLVVATKATPR